MKTTKENFDLFKEECKKWIDRFELNNWGISFYQRDRGKLIGATSTFNIDGYSCSIILNTEIDECTIGDRSIDDAIKEFAKHEIIHVLLARLSEQAYERFINKSELSEAEEELVRKLTKII